MQNRNSPLSNRVRNIAESQSIRMSAVIDELRRNGENIISLNVGEPDFNTHPEIIRATKKALEQNHTRYSLVPGLLELRNSIAQKLQRENNLQVAPQNILVSNGSKQILYNLFQVLLNPGDEVIIPRPYWVTFPESVKLAEGVPIFVNSRSDHQLDIKQIAKAIGPKTKVILINSPNNPSGAVYPKEDLERLVQLATEKDLYLVSDEAYERLVYDQDFTSLASIGEEAFKRTLTVQSFSKSYCMTGFRLGYLVADELFVQAMNKLQGHLTGNNCTFSQYGAIQALHMPTDVFDNMLSEFKQRRDLAFTLFSQILPCSLPGGAFYLFMDVKKYLKNEIQSCEDLVEIILRQGKVACLPGSAFGMPGFIRISFTASQPQIQTAFERMRGVLCELE